jgi:hypothetical protein
MAQEKKNKQAIIVGMRAIGYTIVDSGLLDDPDFAAEHPLDMVVGKEDFDSAEDFITVSRLVTRAARIKATKLIEAGKLNELNSQAAS